MRFVMVERGRFGRAMHRLGITSVAWRKPDRNERKLVGRGFTITIIIIINNNIIIIIIIFVDTFTSYSSIRNRFLRDGLWSLSDLKQ